MPKCRIGLANGYKFFREGGCFACIGRYEGERGTIRSVVANQSSEIVSVEYDLDSCQSWDDAKSDPRFLAMLDWILNRSVWQDAYLTQDAEVVVEDEWVGVKAQGISAQYMVNAMSVIRRSIYMLWYRKWYELVEAGIEEGLAFIVVNSGNDGWRDNINDEQVITFHDMGKIHVYQFVNGTLRPHDWDKDVDYATMYGYPQEIINQWCFGTSWLSRVENTTNRRNVRTEFADLEMEGQLPRNSPTAQGFKEPFPTQKVEEVEGAFAKYITIVSATEEPTIELGVAKWLQNELAA